MSTDLKRLADFFPAEDLSWKPITISKKTNKGLAAAYVDNRAIMDRLDDVCGPADWRNEFRPGPDGGVVCGLSIRVPREDGASEWVTKWDGAENTDIEATKGGLSGAMRRAAVQWGIGRYLYDLPQQWVPVDERGRFVQPPAVPPQFLPPGTTPAPGREPAPRSAPGTNPASRPQTGAAPRPAPKTSPGKGAPQGEAGDYFMPQDLPF